MAPSVLNLAFDLGTTLDIIAGRAAGHGKISVHPTKLGVVGHGFGGSAAVFAAAGMPAKPKAVVAAFPTVTKPPRRGARGDAEGSRPDPDRPGRSDVAAVQRGGAGAGVGARDAARSAARSRPGGWSRAAGWPRWSGCPAPTAAPRRWCGR